MVQSRQLNHDHVDAHYAAAIFKYLKSFAVKFREYTALVFMDDKHGIKVGEPGYPVAAVGRGKSVLVSRDTVFAVADHDFTKLKITPSVTLGCDIPESESDSFYRGKVFRNPVERMMSVINLGLQAIGVMRKKMTPDMERLFHSVNTMKEARAVAEKRPGLKQAIVESTEQVRGMINTLLQRLSLKKEAFSCVEPATDLEAYGRETTEADRPSLKVSRTTGHGMPFSPNAEITRGVVTCLDCNKPRTVHSQRALTIEQRDQLEQLKEEAMYTCGVSWAPQDHPLRDICCVSRALSCSAPVEVHYYSARVKSRAQFLSLVCWQCGETDTLPIPPEKLQEFQSIHPVCQGMKTAKEEAVKEEAAKEEAAKEDET
ncbi:hypothetical protein Bbelb_344370 [Branchiostoma belcheri]|nr:hypothetical protein Bbelb_344370 [Branchiostoma belcheri]